MKLDKETLIAIVACMALLMLTPFIANRMYPPKPAPPKPVTPIAATNATPTPATSPVSQPPLSEFETVAAEPEQPLPPEQTVTLANDHVRIEFTSWGGGIKSIELLQHKNNSTGRVQLNHPHVTPALALLNLPGAGVTAAYKLTPGFDNRSITMQTTNARGVRVEKSLSLGEHYVLTGSMTVTHPTTPSSNEDMLKVVIGTATPATDKEMEDYLAVAWMADGKFQTRKMKNAQKGSAAQPVIEPLTATWAAVKSQFFAMLLTPSTNTAIRSVAFHKVELPKPAEWKQKKTPNGITASAALAPAASDTHTVSRHYDFTYYVGPKEYDRLADLGDEQEAVMDFGFFGAISVLLLKSMNFFYRLIPNYGISIIIITIIIKILFWPIQAKSIKSMKEMQKFQPLMAKLKEKYKDDPQRMNMEMMKLYKEHKINPFAGCLPMVVQIPVFFALFAMLRSSIELRGAPFLWIHDLSQPDTIAHILGFALNPLPLVMGVTMIWQMKLTPSAGDPKQQQMMMIMPLVFLFICYNMSSGLVLYWTVQQLLSIAQQWWSLRDHATAASPAAKK